MSTALLVVGIVSLLHAVNAHFPRKARLILVPSFFMSWLTIELAPWWLFWQVVAAVALVANGALDESTGVAGLVLVGLGSLGLVNLIVRARHTTLEVSEALGPLELDPDDSAPTFPSFHVLFPILMRRREGVVRERNLPFATGTLRNGKEVTLRLDVTKPAEAKPGDRRPGILQIHGGGWVVGDKREQGIPLLNHLAANGWVGINANYRLSPKVGYPEHLIDCKRAIAWWREHAEEHGGDPDFLCVTGGSAGGHLCALVGLTANDPRFQPGFEDVDTTVRAAVPFYGVYDFTNRNGTWHHQTVKMFFEPVVMKRKLAEDPEAFRSYSPLDLPHPDAPPFFVIHGSVDVLAPVADAREFVHRLRDVSDQPVLYAEMKGAQHAFEIFPSRRAARVIEGVERFLHSVHRAYVEGRSLSVAAAADELVEGEVAGGTGAR